MIAIENKKYIFRNEINILDDARFLLIYLKKLINDFIIWLIWIVVEKVVKSNLREEVVAAQCKKILIYNNK